MCAAGDQCDVHVGQRVEHQGAHGTVKYVGEVAPQPGVWIGVEWDDPTRGKHDGSHNGVKYFTTSHPTSGSFVRISKIATGQSCVDAIRTRYGRVEGETVDIDPELVNEMKKQMNAPCLEMVGFDKVNRKQSQFNSLKVVMLRDHRVRDAGESGTLAALCPSIEELDLSHTLVESWSVLADITKQLPRLQHLLVSDNKLAIPTKEEALKLADSFINVRLLVMRNMGYTWTDILHCAVMWPNVETLSVEGNKVCYLESPPAGVLTRLSDLHLQYNPIHDWSEVNKLGSIISLKSLLLTGTGLKKVFFPGERKTNLFSALAELRLSENLIDSWDSISELDKLPALTSLHIAANPIMKSSVRQNTSDNRIFEMIIARIANLKNLNGSVISPGDRTGAEYDYMKRYGPEWLAAQNNPVLLCKFNIAHPRYLDLVNKHGSFGADELVTQSTPLKSRMVSVKICCLDHPNKPCFTKRLPKNMSVQKLSGLAQKLFDTGGEMPTLAALSSKTPDAAVILDKDLQDLSFYGVEDGDVINVQW